MLSRVALESSLELQESYDKRQLRMLPDEGTPLRDVSTLSEPVEMIDAAAKTNDDIVEIIEDASMHVVPLTPVTHDESIDETATIIASSVNKRLRLAKWVATDIIPDILEEIRCRISLTNPEPIIREIKINDFFFHPVLRELTAGYERIPTDSPLGFDEFRDKDILSYLESIQYNNGIFNNKIMEEIIDVVKKENILQFVLAHFTNGTSLAIETGDLHGSSHLNLYENTLVYLLGRYIVNLYASVDSGIMDLNDRLYNLISVAKYNIFKIIDAFRKSLDERRLLLEMYRETDGTTTFCVHQDLYIDFVKEGGTPVALMGAVVSNDYKDVFLKLTLDKFIEYRQTFVENYDSYMKSFLQTTRQQKVSTYHSVLVSSFPELGQTINNRTNKYQGETYTEWYTRALNVLNESPKIDDVYLYVTRTICEAFLPEYQLSNLFTRINELVDGKGNDEGVVCTPRQAVYYIVLDEVVTHLLTQVSLSKGA